MILCVTEYCCHNTKNFSGIVKKLHFGVKIFFFFLKFPFVLESFGLALLVPLTLL